MNDDDVSDQANGLEDGSEGCEVRILRAIRQIIRATDLYSRKTAEAIGLTTPQLVCLKTLDVCGSLTAVDLSRRVFLSPSTLVGVLDRLEAKGLILRERSREDRRKITLRVTHAGQELVQRAPSPLQDQLVNALQGLDEPEQSSLACALEQVVGFMEIQRLEDEASD